MLSLVQTIFATHLNVEALSALQLWTHHNVDEKNARYIQFEIKAVNIYTIVNMICALFAAVVYMFPSENIQQMCFPLNIIEDYAPNWKNELFFMYKMSYPLTALAMTASSNQVVYTACHARIQVYIVLSMKKLLLHIDNLNSEKACKLLHDKEFQEHVKRGMISVIKRSNKCYK